MFGRSYIIIFFTLFVKYFVSQISTNKKEGYMAQAKLKITIDKTPIGNKIVRISDEAYSVVMSLSAETGIPANKLVSRMVLFACENIEIISEEGENN